MHRFEKHKPFVYDSIMCSVELDAPPKKQYIAKGIAIICFIIFYKKYFRN
jgi:hypothetical protein